ncbi:MAG: peptide ABC transporter substrate-binding protein [Epsilonproteobacteria bacterium]|nr:peptide ABC transporter substrate-binding protein [Campylobacterota bacterium]
MLRFIVIISLIIYLYGSEFRASISSSPNRINPLLATDSASSQIADWIFNGLVKFNKDAKIVGDLAKSWEFENNTTLIFKLRDNVFWHDGVKFSADDVIFTYNLLKSPKISTPYSSDFNEVKDVKKIDDFTIKVTYKRPYFKALSIWMMGILPKHLWEKEKNPMQSKLNKFAVGTGPYRMIKPFEVNKNIELIANEKYYLHKPNINKIIYKYVGDSATEFLLLKSMQLDIGGLSPLQVSRQIDKKFKENFNIYERPSNGYTYLGFNLRKPPFNNPKIREAIALAINKQELIDLLFFSHGKPCYGPFMPGTNAYPKDLKPLSYNPKRAKEILKELGYTKENPLTFTIITNSGNDIRVKAAEIILQQLLKVGIKAKLRVLEWQAFLNTIVFPRNFEAVILGWSLGLIPDAYSIWHSDGDKKGGFNFVGYHNKEVDRLIEKAKSEIDPIKFGKIYQKIFKLIVNDHPYIFLYIPNSITAVNKKIEGIEPSIIGIMHNFIDWKIKVK